MTDPRTPREERSGLSPTDVSHLSDGCHVLAKLASFFVHILVALECDVHAAVRSLDPAKGSIVVGFMYTTLVWSIAGLA